MAESYRVNPALLRGIREADYTEPLPIGIHPTRFLKGVKSKPKHRKLSGEKPADLRPPLLSPDTCFLHRRHHFL